MLLWKRIMLTALTLTWGTALTHRSFAEDLSGITAGQHAPDFKLPDTEGQTHNLKSLYGRNGVLILFSRSADWCGLCKQEIADLDRSRALFEKKGIKVAVITYDSSAALKNYQQRTKVALPLLSDVDSTSIKAYGILNANATGTQAGIPYPGFYLIGPDGVVKRRFFEEATSNRFTAHYIYEELYGLGSALPPVDASKLKDPHVTFQTVQSDKDASPIARVRLSVQFTPDKGTHLYAPGAEKNGYRVLQLVLDPADNYTASTVHYPVSETLRFASLKEDNAVFPKPGVLSVDILPKFDRTNNPFATNPELAIHGRLLYQACTDTVCFPPAEAKLSWKINVLPFDRARVPEDLQRR